MSLLGQRLDKGLVQEGCPPQVHALFRYVFSYHLAITVHRFTRLTQEDGGLSHGNLCEVGRWIDDVLNRTLRHIFLVAGKLTAPLLR